MNWETEKNNISGRVTFRLCAPLSYKGVINPTPLRFRDNSTYSSKRRFARFQRVSLKSPSKKRISCEGLTRSAYAVLSFKTGVYRFNSWSFKGDNHHKDSVIYFSLTSSRYRLNTRTAESRLHNYYCIFQRT